MVYLCLMQQGDGHLENFYETALKNNFTVIATEINEDASFIYPDMALSAEQWNSKVINILSSQIECDSENIQVRLESEKRLLHDISWTEHLQYHGYTLIRLKTPKNINLARIVTKSIKGALLVQVPAFNSKLAQAMLESSLSESDEEKLYDDDTWQWWNQFRFAADFNPKLRVVLELNELERPSEECVRRWLGEPLEAIIVTENMFIRNKHNYPVLPRAWQDTLKHFARARVNIIVSLDTMNNSISHYAHYLQKFSEDYADNHSLQSFEDVLEVPLQPLYDNLDCYTYEIFEKDPVKYKLYQDAISAALVDRVPEDEAEEKLTIIMVLGAGRGPLVRAALNASANTKRKIRVYIIEKNPNAIRTLECVVKKLWSDKDVHLISKDMREFSPPEKADILVSELLGSFGDNELSPECLDCAQVLLKDDGISIPCKSTSYINPVMSSKLFNNMRSFSKNEQWTREKQQTYFTHSDSAYVTLLKNVYHIDYPQALFEFVHPNREQPIDNRRFKALKFTVKSDCVLTGIAGYFDAILYKDIILSINTDNHTKGMASWFPMYFTFASPMNIKKDDVIEIHFWRCVSKQKIWYEWCSVSPHISHIHNHNGRSCPINC